MTRARDTAGIIQYSNLTIDSNNAVGIGSSQPDTQLDVNGGVRVTGIITATSFEGDGSQLTGIDATSIKDINGTVRVQANEAGAVVTGILTATNLEVTSDTTISGNLTVQGTTVTLDTTVQEVDLLNIQANSTTPAIGVTQSGSGAIAAFYDGAVGVATFKDGGGLDVAGAVVASSFSGSLAASNLTGALPAIDGSALTGVISGIGITGGSSGGSFTSNLGVALTAINFSGATVEYHEATGLSTVTIASAGLATEFSSPSGITTYLDLDNAQDHKLTVSGITTISVTGGTEGESHTIRIINSGIATVGFSTYFLWPSGSIPTLPTADGTINLISFTVNRVGAAGTQLLAGASVNFS